MSYETLNLEKTENVCPACEEYAGEHSVCPPRIAILACEGACAKGEVARQAANLIAHRLVPEKAVRICLGGAFTKDSGQRELVRRAVQVIALEGCFIDCSSRMMKSVIPDLEPVVVRADRLYDAKLPFGVDEVPHEMLVIYAGEVAKKVVEGQIAGTACTCASSAGEKACDGGQRVTSCSAGLKPADFIRATWDGQASFTSRSSAGAELTLGGSGQTPTAIDALAAALGTCAGLSTLAKLGERGCKPEALNVGVGGRRRATAPTSFESLHVSLTLAGDLDEKVVAECVDQAMTQVCPIATTLAKAAELTWEYRLAK